MRLNELHANKQSNERNPIAPLVQEVRKRREPAKPTRALLPILVAVLVSVGVILLLTRCQEQLEDLREWGYAGAFIIAFLGSSTVILPAPSLAFTTALGTALNPVLLGLIAGLAAALGELTGYLAGLGGKVMVEDRPFYERVKGYTDRHGGVAFFVMAAIPNPMFDFVGIAAGVMRYSVLHFLLVVWAGNAVKCCVFAAMGHHLFG